MPLVSRKITTNNPSPTTVTTNTTPPPPPPTTTTTTTKTTTTATQPSSNQTHHTLLSATSLTNLRSHTPELSIGSNSNNTPNPSHPRSNLSSNSRIIKRSNSFGANQPNSNLISSLTTRNHYITHSTSKRSINSTNQSQNSVLSSKQQLHQHSQSQSRSSIDNHQPQPTSRDNHSSSRVDRLTATNVFGSAFSRPDFFKRHLNPSSSSSNQSTSSSLNNSSSSQNQSNNSLEISHSSKHPNSQLQAGIHHPLGLIRSSKLNHHLSQSSAVPNSTPARHLATSLTTRSNPLGVTGSGPSSAQILPSSSPPSPSIVPTNSQTTASSNSGCTLSSAPAVKKKSDSISSITGISLPSIGFLVGSSSSSNHSSSGAANSTMNFTTNHSNSSNSSHNHKTVIRHITSSSTLASLASHNNSISLPKLQDVTSLTSSGHHYLQHPHLHHLHHQHNSNSESSLNHGLAGLTLRPGDVWSQVALRVMPLFNGEGHKGFIEDLNEFVSQHIHKTIADSPSKSILKLHSDIVELFSNGIITLNYKLQPDTLSSERLLFRLVEVWHFFFTGVLPYLEGIFLPMMTDQSLISVIESKNNKVLQEKLQQQHLLQQATTNAGLLSSSSSSILFRSSNNSSSRSGSSSTNQLSKHRPTGSQSIKSDESIQAIDIRRLALIAFRDQLIQPIFARLYYLLGLLYDSNLNFERERRRELSPECQTEQMHSKLLQMVGLLCSVQTEDSKQAAMEELGKLIRVGKTNPELFKMSVSVSNNGKVLSVSSSSSTSSRSHIGSADSSANKSGNRENEQPREWKIQSPMISRQLSHSPVVQGVSSPTSRSNGEAVEEDVDDDKPLGHLLNGKGQPQIRGWNKNRDFARRSIRRQLGRNGTKSGEVGRGPSNVLVPSSSSSASLSPNELNSVRRAPGKSVGFEERTERFGIVRANRMRAVKKEDYSQDLNQTFNLMDQKSAENDVQEDQQTQQMGKVGTTKNIEETQNKTGSFGSNTSSNRSGTQGNLKIMMSKQSSLEEIESEIKSSLNSNKSITNNNSSKNLNNSSIGGNTSQGNSSNSSNAIKPQAGRIYSNGSGNVSSNSINYQNQHHFQIQQLQQKK
ncbi:HbrB-like-domain-containing protein [Phakopsora pachyrhizi]|uniref:HbrB-like-domain-containing protein n=1 Tax=Phakopsora pachyrhizi TaxID=170000 RepID=A0AAV0B892_PHAPC|nr:HbrB-like-domain-containing protein [Phakopsora pachyrhizi]